MIEKKEEFNFKLFWNTRQELVLAILFFLIAAMILFGGALKQITPIKESLNDLESKDRELNRFRQKALQLEETAIDPEFAKISEIDQVLPSHKPLLELLSNLNSVANETEVAIDNFSLSPGKIASDTTQVKKNTSQEQKYDALFLNFSVSGALGRVQRFMDLIEQTTPISTITSISLSRQINDDSLAETKANLELKIFYFTQPIKTTIASPLPEISVRNKTILAEIQELIPNNLPTQDEIITGNRGNLFGLQNISIEDLEEQLQEGVLASGSGELN